MSITTVSLTLNVLDDLGVAASDVRDVKVRVRASNLAPGELVIDTAGNSVRFPSGWVNPDANGAVTIEGIIPTDTTDAIPSGVQYVVEVEYPHDGKQPRNTLGPFDLNLADATVGVLTLADLGIAERIAPNYVSEAMAAMQGYLTEGQGLLDQQVDISNIDTSDDAVEALLKGTGGAGPKTRAELSATVARDVADALATDPAALPAPTALVPTIKTRTGSPVNPVTAAAGVAGQPMTQSVPVVSQPAWTKLTGYKAVAEPSPSGEVILQKVADNTYWTTSDGGVTLTQITPSGATTGISNGFYDSAGNLYVGTTTIYRAPAGTYVFTACFTFDSGAAAKFSHAVMGAAIVVAEYTTGAGDSGGSQVWRSGDNGATWAVTVVDVGQRHHHAVIGHPATGRFYLSTGEPTAALENGTNGRRMMKSEDGGATWTQVHDFNPDTAGRQQTSALVMGRYILWGLDSVPTGWTVHDTTTETFTPINMNARAKQALTYSGYYFAMVATPQGYALSPGEKNIGQTEAVSPINLLRTLAGEIVTFLNPHYARQVQTNGVLGPDASGHVYIEAASGTDVYAMLPPTVTDRTGYCTVSPTGVVGVATPTGTSEPEAGVTVGGAQVLLVTLANGNTFNSVPVTPGRKYRFVWMIRRGTGSLTNLRLNHWWKTGAAFTSNSQVTPDFTTQPWPDDYVRLVTATFTAPAGVDSIQPTITLSTDTGAANAHHIVGRVVVYEDATLDHPGPNDPAWMIDTLTEQLTVNRLVGEDFLFRDRIYQQGVPDYLRAADHPLISLPEVEIGVKGNATPSNTVVYVAPTGGARQEIVMPQWGARLGGKHVRWTQSGYRVTNVAPPLTVGITRDAVHIVNTETNATHTVTLTQKIIGLLDATLRGTAVHVPDLAEATTVPTAAVRTA